MAIEISNRVLVSEEAKGRCMKNLAVSTTRAVTVGILGVAND
jgi:hypothetical protein